MRPRGQYIGWNLQHPLWIELDILHVPPGEDVETMDLDDE